MFSFTLIKAKDSAEIIRKKCINKIRLDLIANIITNLVVFCFPFVPEIHVDKTLF